MFPAVFLLVSTMPPGSTPVVLGGQAVSPRAPYWGEERFGLWGQDLRRLWTLLLCLGSREERKRTQGLLKQD